MARRYPGKASPRIAAARARGGRGKPKAAASEGALRERLVALERERDALRATLQREQERTRKLEEVQAAARDRIAWALESLQNIIDPKG